MAATMWTEIIENYVRGEQKEGVTSITAGNITLIKTLVLRL